MNLCSSKFLLGVGEERGAVVALKWDLGSEHCWSRCEGQQCGWDAPCSDSRTSRGFLWTGPVAVVDCVSFHHLNTKAATSA